MKDSNNTSKCNGTLRLEHLESRVLLSASAIDDIGNSIKTALVANLDDSGDFATDSDLYSRKDKDMITFTATGSGQMTLTLDTSESDLLPIVKVYNQRRKLVTASNFRLHEDQTALAFLVEEGCDYSVRIQSARRTSGEYSLSLDGPTGQQWAQDYGNKRSQAEVVSEMGLYSGEILSARGNDTDYFAFTAIGSGTVTVTMTPESQTLNAVLIARRASGKAIAKSNVSATDGSESVTFDVESGKTYYVQADGYKRTQGQYSLEFTGSVLSEPMISDPNDISDSVSGFENIHAVLIGGSDYTRLNSLPEAAADVDLMAETLEGVFGVSSENITTLVGGRNEVNFATVKSAISWLDSNTGEKDLAIFYYSGHGSYGKSYLKDDNETLILPDNNQITEAYLEKVLMGFDSSSTKMLILDSCYSGGFAGIANSVDNTVVIASSAYDQISWGNMPAKTVSKSQGSVFTDWFTRALAENSNISSALDINGDTKVSFSEAFTWTNKMVNDITGSKCGNQDPIMNILKGDIIL